MRGYGQRDPLTEYKREAFDLFQDMIERVKAAVVERLFKVQIVRDAPMELPAITTWADVRESRSALPADSGRAVAPAPALSRAARLSHPHRREDRPQRSLLLRLGQEVQEVLPPQGALTVPV